MPRSTFLLAAAACLVLAACAAAERATNASPPPAPPTREIATFAGGCFWCLEAVFDGLPGVESATSGYTGGLAPSPTYEQVSEGGTGHAEAVRIVYDPALVTYQQLLDLFWTNVDPTTPNRQFCDTGSQYRAAIFTHDAAQEKLARDSKAALEASKPFEEPVVTEIVGATTFYPAEDYHQDYASKNPVRYKVYRYGCGRDKRLRELWGERAGGGKH